MNYLHYLILLKSQIILIVKLIKACGHLEINYYYMGSAPHQFMLFFDTGCTLCYFSIRTQAYMILCDSM